jgi:hypothetical protein
MARKIGPVRTHSWVTFPFKFVKVEDFPNKNVKVEDFLNKNVKVEDATDRWVSDASLLNNKCVLSGFIFFPWLLATWLLFLNSPLKF